MERRRFGSLNCELPTIGQGTWFIERTLGGRGKAIAAMRRGLDLGMTHIDTAEMYGSGIAEILVGEAIAGRRAEVFLVSKVLPQNASRTGTFLACEGSLARLKTDWLDCYLLHWRGHYPLEETFEAFRELKSSGKIRSWGVSNFDVPDLEEAFSLGGELTCNQVLYHLQERAIEHAVIPWCERHGVAVVAYSPFGHGHFPGQDTRGGRVLSEVAVAHGATVRQIALQFLTRRKSVFAIPKASESGHAEENASAADLQLTPGEIARIEEAFPLGPPAGNLPML